MAWTAGGGFTDAGSGAVSTTTRSGTMSASVAVNDVIVVGWTRAGSVDDIATDTITDNLGNTYTILDHALDATDTQVVCSAYTIVTSAGTATITATSSAGHTYRMLQAQAFRYSSAGAPSLDVHGGAAVTTYGTGTDTVKCPSVTPTSDNDLLVGFVNNTSSLSGLTAGTGFTSDKYSGVTTQGPCMIEHKSLGTGTSGVAQQPTATVSGSSQFVNQTAAFKPPAAGTTITITPATIAGTATVSAAVRMNPKAIRPVTVTGAATVSASVRMNPKAVIPATVGGVATVAASVRMNPKAVIPATITGVTTVTGSITVAGYIVVTPATIGGSSLVSASVRMNPVRVIPAGINGVATVTCVPLTGIIPNIPAATYASLFVDIRGRGREDRELFFKGRWGTTG